MEDWTPEEANKMGEGIEEVEALATNHNHDAVYLGINAQAADSAKWNGESMPADSAGALMNDGTGVLSWQYVTGDYLPLAGGTETGDVIMDSSAGQRALKFSWTGTSIVKLVHHSVLVAGDKVFGIYDETNARPTFTYNPDTNATIIGNTAGTVALNGAVTSSGDITATGRVIFGPNSNCMTSLAANTDLQAPLPSGFYDCPSPVNGPAGANWTHLINSCHYNSYVGNCYQLQIGTGFWMPADLWFRATNAGNTNPAWQHIHSGPGASGSITYTDTLGGSATLEKYIDMGRPYSLVMVQFNHSTEAQTGAAGTVFFCTQNYLATVGVGGCYTGGGWIGRAWAREKYGVAANQYLARNSFNGGGNIGADEIFISGNNLYIRYHNYNGGSEALQSCVYWRALA